MKDSKALMKEATAVIPGGVNSPVRAFRAVGGEVVFMERGKGAYLYDVEGKRYIDYVGTWGPAILGHGNARVVEAVCEAAAKGLSLGTATEGEIALAEKVVGMVESIEMLRLVNSGTEATMTALRLARAVTGRDKVVKIVGGYHGHADSFLVKAGSGAATLGVPNSPGVPAAVAADTLSVQFNDVARMEAIFAGNAGEIAAVILEPVMGNAGVILPEAGYLEAVRELTRREQTVLIFDEVMTGFRLARGGAQEVYGVRPDLTTLGKIIGGGMPIGAIGGRRELMEQLAPAGHVYQAGTLAGNPVAVAAGLATLEQLDDELYAGLEAKAAALEKGIGKLLQKLSLPYVYQRVGSMGCLFFTNGPVTNYADAERCDTQAFGDYFRKMLGYGVYLAPSQFETGFLSATHSEDNIAETLAAMESSLK